jgi:mannan endo-1,4-beta-mannosidase
MVTRTEATASAITTVDPSAQVLGGVMYGWSEYQSLSDAPDSKDYKPQYETYVDYYLASMKELEQKYKRRLVHVLDVHWYPEARGAKRITDDDLSEKTVDARVQAPRALWDATYREKSWIDESWGKPIRLIPWLKEKIDKQYPGTKLSMTEYDFGAGNHVSGGIAQADVLGVLGREGVYLANYWGSGPGNGPLPAYVAAAFKLFRNYDGKGGTFGDTAVSARGPDAVKTSVFAATDSRHPQLLTVIIINKDQRARYTGNLAVQGPAKYKVGAVFRMDKTAPGIQRAADPVEMRENRLEYALPPLSATLLVLEKQPAQP